MPASYFETVEFNSCYSHWKLNPKPSSRKSTGRYSRKLGIPPTSPIFQSPEVLHQELQHPKIEFKAPQFKKTMRSKKTKELKKMVDAFGNSQELQTDERASDTNAPKISFTEVVINSMEDFKKVPKETSRCSKRSMSPKPTPGSPIAERNEEESDASFTLIQQILQEEKKFDDEIQKETRAALEIIQENRRTLSLAASRHRVSGVAFPLSRIPSLEKLQFTMNLGDAGHNFSGHNFSGVVRPNAEYSIKTHVPLSSHRTTSFEKFLPYWQDCIEPIQNIESIKIKEEEFSNLDELLEGENSSKFMTDPQLGEMISGGEFEGMKQEYGSNEDDLFPTPMMEEYTKNSFFEEESSVDFNFVEHVLSF